MATRHIDAVRTIDEAVYANPWGVATWRNELATADRHHIVAIEDDILVGHAGLLFMLEEAHVTTVAVDPSREGKGIATAMLVDLLGEARAHGSTGATLEVRAADKRPQRLYGRFGFRPVGVRKDYYSTPIDDGIVMWLTDLQDAEVGDRISEIAAALTHSTEV